MRLIVDYSFSDLICEVFASQAKKSDQNLKEITNKVYFDVEIAGKPAGMFYYVKFWILIVIWKKKKLCI